MKRPLSFLRYARRASALIITLAILTLVAILVVGLSDTMRVERASANTHLERGHAMDFAHLGVARVVALLKTNIGDRQKTWVSAPGLLVCSIGSTGNDRKLTREVDLYSGVSAYSTATSGCPVYCLPPNLNVVLMSDTTGTTHNLITNRSADPDSPGSGVVALPLKWIYVRSDGSWDKDEPPVLTNKSNPIIGRFAYWADDESGKINYNTAWKRPLPANNPPPQCAVNLLALNYTSGSAASAVTTSMVDALHNAVTTSNPAYLTVNRFFNSPQDARSLETTAPGIGSLVESNKFELTHYNNDPNTTFFNEPRIILTTQAQLAQSGSLSFLDILYKANVDPGVSAYIDSGKYSATVAKLMSYMQRTDWPMVSGSGSLQDKYFSSNPDRLAQLAINIIDYVRCKESSQALVAPIRGSMTSGTFTITADQTENGFVGMGRTPLINELGFWLSDDMKTAMLIVELYLPQHYGIDSLDLSKYALGVDIDGHSYASVGGKAQLIESNILAAECDGGALLNAGGYKVVRRTLDMTTIESFKTRPSQVALRVDFAAAMSSAGSPGTRLDIVPQVAWDAVTGGNQNAYMLTVPIAPAGTAQSGIQSKEVDDPRVNKFQADWNLCSSGHTFGSRNSCYSVGKKADSSVLPQQDTDLDGNISDASLYMPYPKGKGDNLTGRVLSPAELGVIHTGVQGSGIKGTPWRTVRLQPSKNEDTSVVPDWAFMDLFDAPTNALSTTVQDNIQAVFNPHGTAVGGRVSVNSQAQPFGNPNYSSCSIPLERIDPLVAVFLSGSYTIRGTTTSGTTISLDDAKTLARHIYDHQLANGGRNFSQANLPGTNAKFYTSPGEIVEIEGVSDGGEESEAKLGVALGLVTARGNVFSIYTIGQALKQTSSGALVVRGEQRLQAMVERYVDGITGAVKFRTVYFRNLTP